MSFLSDLFGAPPCPAPQRPEVDRLIHDLIQIGIKEDYLSERPGGAFNQQCRHIRSREIGKRLNEIGGLPLMEYAYKKVKSKASKQLAIHLEYAWNEVGEWNY